MRDATRFDNKITDDKINDLESKINDLESKINDLESKINNLESKINNLDQHEKPSIARSHTWDFETDTIKTLTCRNVESFAISFTPGKVSRRLRHFNLAQQITCR